MDYQIRNQTIIISDCSRYPEFFRIRMKGFSSTNYLQDKVWWQSRLIQNTQQTYLSKKLIEILKLERGMNVFEGRTITLLDEELSYYNKPYQRCLIELT